MATDEEKEAYQKEAPYILWRLEKQILPEIVKEAETFRQSQKTRTDNDLVAVQVMSWKAILDRIKALRKEFNSRPQCQTSAQVPHPPNP